MKIIEFEPQFWFLLKDDENYFIDVNCNHSFVGFTLLIKLNELEKMEYMKSGIEYIKTLANAIQYNALTKYNDRNIIGEMEKSIHEAIMKFNIEKNIR